MSLLVDPARVSKQPLMLHQREAGEYWVIIAGFVAGRVSRCEVGDGETRWLWYMTGPQDHNDGVTDFGDGQSLLAAKEALRLSVQNCVDEAVRANAMIGWAQ